MRNANIALAVTLTLVVTSGGSPSSKEASPMIGKLERYLKSAVAEEHFSGVVMVARHGTALINQGYGMATEKIENTGNTVIHVGSVTKQFTAAAILLLWEEGEIDLNVSINRYLPKNYQSVKWEPVTIHHLLSHTSGITDYAVQRDYYDVRKGFCFGSTIDGMLHEAQEKDLEFTPGSTFRYSNIGYTLLGVIIERVSGHPYSEFIRIRLLIPAKMFSSGIHEETYIEKEGHAKGYRWDEKLEKFVEDDVISLPVTPPDGGLYTTTEDLLKWSRVIGRKTPGILSSQVINKMTTPVKVALPPDDSPWSHDGRDGSGYGLFIDKLAGATRFHHPGYIVGFRSHSSLFPEKDFFIAVLCNNTTADPMKIADGLSKILLEGK